MADLVDARTKIDRDDHAMLTALSLASGDDIATILRDLVHEFCDRKRHEHTVISNVLRGEGVSGNGGERNA
jgi:hypothetical protein